MWAYLSIVCDSKKIAKYKIYIHFDYIYKFWSFCFITLFRKLLIIYGYLCFIILPSLAAIALYISYIFTAFSFISYPAKDHIQSSYYIYLYFLYLFLFYIMWLNVLWCMLVSRISYCGGVFGVYM